MYIVNDPPLCFSTRYSFLSIYFITQYNVITGEIEDSKGLTRFRILMENRQRNGQYKTYKRGSQSTLREPPTMEYHLTTGQNKELIWIIFYLQPLIYNKSQVYDFICIGSYSIWNQDAFFLVLHTIILFSFLS
jgi:hypothetical protein